MKKEKSTSGKRSELNVPSTTFNVRKIRDEFTKAIGYDKTVGRGVAAYEWSDDRKCLKAVAFNGYPTFKEQIVQQGFEPCTTTVIEFEDLSLKRIVYRHPAKHFPSTDPLALATGYLKADNERVIFEANQEVNSADESTYNHESELRKSEQLDLNTPAFKEEFFNQFESGSLLNTFHTPEFSEKQIIIGDKILDVDIFTDKTFINTIKGGGAQGDFIVQMKDELGRIITIKSMFHRNCDIDFSGLHFALSPVEKAITSTLLYAGHRQLPFFPMFHKIFFGIIWKHSMTGAYWVLD